MREFIAHFFIPRESNNHRAKVLHNFNIFLTIVFLVLASFYFQRLKIEFPSVLGIQVDISTQELLNLTNQERQNNGVASLSYSDKLAQAASQKADDMFTYDYWAHVSPSGKTPWVFIKGAGYNYVYAGENLAKGFSTAQDAVSAWMASPDHRANVLSSNYKDVGFAVKTGNLNGEDTILIVEEFGSQTLPVAKPEQEEIATADQENQVQEQVLITPTQMQAQKEVVQQKEEPVVTINNPIPAKSVVALKEEPLINSASLSKNMTVTIAMIFISALILDMMIIERKQITRFVGHNLDHISYFLLIIALIGIISRGVIT